MPSLVGGLVSGRGSRVKEEEEEDGKEEEEEEAKEEGQILRRK